MKYDNLKKIRILKIDVLKNVNRPDILGETENVVQELPLKRQML